MDELVKAAMAKWPNVPHCYGWLGLDARGQWWMRDEAAQSVGPFAGPGSSMASRGVRLQHDKLVAFIGRNYGVDANGCWYFQNGPQRVYVELELTPWVWRIEPSGQLTSHTEQNVEVANWCVDERGYLLGQSQRGWGLLHTLDVARWAEVTGAHNLREVVWAQWLAKEACYCLSPQQQQYHPTYRP